MTAHEFIQDGITYVPSKIAAKCGGLSADYISRMCREGQVLCTWHQGAWYVHEKSLANVLAARRVKLDELARLQSETLKRQREERQAVVITEAPLIPRAHATSTHARPSRVLPAIALPLITVLLLATSVLALPQSTRKKITAQLPFTLQTKLANLRPQLPFNAPTQLAAAATSFPTSITQKIRNVFCWWLECENTTVEIAQQRPRPSPNRQTNGPPPISATSAARVIAVAPIQETLIQQRPAQPATQTIVNQPIIERVIETRTIASGISEALLDSRLLALTNDLTSRMNSLSAKNANQTVRTIENIADALRIDELTNTILHSPTIDGGTIRGGSISGATINGTLSNIINTALATIGDLTATHLVATNATTTNATSTNLYVSGTATIGSGTGILKSTSGVVSAIGNGSAGQVLKIVGGSPEWSTDLTGGGGGAGAWATTSNDLALYPSDPTDVILIGSNSTSTSGIILEVVGASLFRGALSAYNTITAPVFTATSTSATSTLPRLSITGTLGIGADYVTDITGTGITLSSGALTLETSGDWSGTLGSYSPAQLIAAGFSTTSADVWKTNRNFFATTSAVYWETQQTARTADDITNNSIEDLNDVAVITENYGDLLFWNGAAWADIATSSLGLPTTGTLASYLTLSDWFATTTDGLDEGSANRYYTDARVQTYLGTVDRGFFFSTTSASYFSSIGLAFSTTSNEYWKTQNNFFSTTSSDFWKTGNNFFSTTSASHFSNLGLAFSSTSATYFLSQNQGPAFSSTSANYLLSTYDKGFFFSTTSADTWKTTRNFFSTTSTEYWKSVTDLFSTSSASYFLAQNQGAGFSTTSAIFFTNASTTIPKTYTANTFTALQQLIAGASTTQLTTTGSTYLATTGGNVGIGTTSPQAKLSISHAANQYAAEFNNTNSENFSGFKNYNDTSSGLIGITYGSTYSAGSVFSLGANSSVLVQTANAPLGIGTVGVAQPIVFGTNNTERMRIDSSGNVGIGTTTPGTKLTVNGDTSYNADPSGQLYLAGATDSTRQLRIGYDTTNNFGFIRAVDVGDAERNLVLQWNGGNVGIASTTPWKTLSVVGTVAVNGLSSSATGNYVCVNTTTWEVTRGNGSACTTSSIRFKENVQDLSYGLSTVSAMRPVVFNYKPELNMGTSKHIGFIAEEMRPLVPEVVNIDDTGQPSGIDYPSLTAVLAQAIKEIATISGSFKQNLIAWLGSTANGIERIVGRVLKGDRVETNELCVGQTCVTEDQFRAAFSPTTPAPPPIPVSSPPSTIRDVAPPESVTSTSTADEIIPVDPISVPANDNPPPAANDNMQPSNGATGTTGP